MTEQTPNPWEGLTLDCVTEDYMHIGNGNGHAFMVLRHLPLGCRAARLNQSFCDEVGRLLAGT